MNIPFISNWNLPFWNILSGKGKKWPEKYFHRKVRGVSINRGLASIWTDGSTYSPETVWCILI